MTGKPTSPTPGCLRSACPVAGALDLIGDRWTLLVLRDLLFFGKRRFAELAASPEGIPTNILAARLRQLEADRIVRRVRYQERPPRYEYHPTARGRDLLGVLRALIEWANRHLPDTGKPSPEFFDRLAAELATASRED